MVWLDALIAGDNFDLLSPWWPYTWNPRLKHCDDTAAIRAAMEHCVAKQDDEPSAAALAWAKRINIFARQPADSTAAQAISGLGVEMVAAVVHGRRSLKTSQEPATKHTDCPGATKMGYNTTVTGAPAFETALQDQIEVLKDLERQSKEKAERLLQKDNIKKLKPVISRVDNLSRHVEYDITLYVDDKDLKKTVFYDRGSATWTEGISDKDVRRGADGTVLQGWSDWCITIADGTVDMKIRSEKFYSNYMTRMLNALKERVPSLHGYVSCRDADVDIYWTITNKVRRYEREEWALTAEARQAYCSARGDQVYKQRHCSNTRKRRLGEEKPKESDEDSALQ